MNSSTRCDVVDYERWRILLAARSRVRAALRMDLVLGQTLSDCAVPDRDRLHILRVSGPEMRGGPRGIVPQSLLPQAHAPHLSRSSLHGSAISIPPRAHAAGMTEGTRVQRLATVLATVRLAIPGNRWPPLATPRRKPQKGHPPGAPRITFPRRYFEDRSQNRRKSDQNTLQTVALATWLCRLRKWLIISWLGMDSTPTIAPSRPGGGC